jgi:polyphosphate glucokinase
MLLSPELFIIGGGISSRHDEFFPYIAIDTPVKPAELRNNAGIVGSALLATLHAQH